MEILEIVFQKQVNPVRNDGTLNLIFFVEGI